MNDTYRNFYEDKALTYPEHDETSVVRYRKAAALAELSPGARLLDIACKNAVLLDLLTDAGADIDYTGVDISERVIEKDGESGRPGRFMVADVMNGLPFEDESFDAIFALEILEHVPHPVRLLEEARRLLAPGGRFLVSVPNPYYYMEVINEIRGYPETEGHLYAFRDGNLRALLEHCGLEVGRVEGTYIQVPKKIRGAFADHAFIVLSRAPRLLARSRVYCCTKA